MGLFSEVKKIARAFIAHYQADKELDIFIKKANKMIKPYELNKQARQEVKEKLQDLKQLALVEALEKEMELGDTSLREREKLLKKYGAKNGPEAIASIAGEINDRYNLRDTDDAKWVDSKVQFFEYSAKNYQELTELKELGSEAKRLQADYLAQKAKNAYQELVEEENNLREMVGNLKPENYKAGWKEVSYDDDYNLTARIIKYKTSLYQEQGRTTLLWAYNQHIKDCGGDPDRVEKGILAADQYWGKEEETQSILKNLTQSARDLRQETKAELENVIKRNQNRFERGL